MLAVVEVLGTTRILPPQQEQVAMAAVGLVLVHQQPQVTMHRHQPELLILVAVAVAVYCFLVAHHWVLSNQVLPVVRAV